jgi:bifunctional DNA-binding transcriptional regulator/antitoxin component of YhaV-PrlF toxin-antitoxin module
MFITSKGPLMILVEIRRKAGLHPHTEVEFVIDEGRVQWQAKPGERVVAISWSSGW